MTLLKASLRISTTYLHKIHKLYPILHMVGNLTYYLPNMKTTPTRTFVQNGLWNSFVLLVYRTYQDPVYIFYLNGQHLPYPKN